MEQRMTFAGPDWEFSLVTPLTPRRVTSEPDPDWRATDKAGHVHAYGPDFSTPTLWWHKVPAADEDGEEYDAGYYQCLECGQRITPGTRQPLGPPYERGQTFCEGMSVLPGVGVPMIVPMMPLTELLPGFRVFGTALIERAESVRPAFGKAYSVIHWRSAGPVQYDREAFAAAAGKPLHQV